MLEMYVKANTTTFVMGKIIKLTIYKLDSDLKFFKILAQDIVKQSDNELGTSHICFSTLINSYVKDLQEIIIKRIKLMN